MNSSNDEAPNRPGCDRSPAGNGAAIPPVEGPPEGPRGAFITTDIELPAAYWDILSGRVKITLRG